VALPLDSKARILNAARSLLEKGSAQFFKVRDIAAIAEVSPALVMRYFKSKDELVFQAALALWTEVGTPELLRWVNEQIGLTSQGFIAKLLHIDLGNGHRTRDLMSMAWWWSTIEEDAFQAALAPRVAIHKGLLLQENGLPAELEDETINRLMRASMILYVDALRRAGVLQRSAEAANAELVVLSEPLMDAFARRALTLRQS